MKIIYHPKVEKEIDSLIKSDKSKVIKVVDLFEEYGFQLSKEYLKKINKNIWELRVSRYRLLFGVIRCFSIIINIFYKKTQKTPIKQIKLAIFRLKQYEK
ncbi:MAG: type II toxin-antitoxin system RelE/ParE family toxin [Patescibacteria group bacterium]|jgi:phage-related protein